MNTSIKITPGLTYMTPEGEVVTALREISPYRALFVCESYCPTPFVSFVYNVTIPNTIELSNPRAYASMAEALSVELADSETLRLEVSFYCPECQSFTNRTFGFDTNVLDLMEQIEDTRMVCPYCHEMFMGITEVALRDPSVPDGYTLPIFRGPTPYNPD
jgi:hypothetical protein